MKWEEKQLDELGYISRGKSRHRPRNDERLYGGIYPLIQTGEIQNANFYINEYSKTYNDFGLSQSKLWEAGTLCISIVGANTAATAILGFDACFPDSVIGFIGKEGKSDTKFVKYFLDTKRIELHRISQGTARENLSMEKLLTMKMPAPPYKTQQKIASILSAYDDGIENNLKRIRLLEEAAQHLYREWFVKFRFPGWKEVKVVDGLPEGWKKVPFSAVAEFINGFAFKPHHHSKDGLPIIKIKELKAGIGNDTPRYQGSDVPEKYKFGDNSILFSWSADLDVYWWASGEALLNQHLFLVHPLKGTNKFHFYYALKNSMEDFRNRTTGATMKHIKRTELDAVFYTKPTKEISELFAEVAKPILSQVLNFTKQNQRLKAGRDLLLPRLMGGVLEV
ncbi:MAG: restriction endonuclease subunit S [Saprospiraceae bacterium]|nr:restriction endonuclease subunit S [Saprospiraceae bacterium]MCF8250208.1 restriction endonuclease subunit S [Saprospiraceae bacterium]MCF8280029.1 restriction endonuclease subunit S [Bacteroidales bacterium]MCF8312016.1 restriction endonuclease subunit S [Saprospiraceae bacterium]MCF8441113.1 restriction endonuclease subunit S [Saprospiraceae bacterium]